METPREKTLVQEFTQRVRESSDGFVIVMPVGGWIDAGLWRDVNLDQLDGSDDHKVQPLRS